MRSQLVRVGCLALVAGTFAPGPALAVDGGAGRSARAAASASAASSAPALPPGHPPTSDLPPGHPDVGDADGDRGEDLPPGHPNVGQAADPNEQRLPEDTADVDKSLPPGTIVVEVRDQLDKPVPHAEVTLGILRNSVAKGESRSRTVRPTDDAGNLRFDGLDAGAGVAYRITVPWPSSNGGEGATYAAFPFTLDLENGQRVRVHVYPVTNRVDEAMVGMQGIVYLELRDDVLQVDELYQVFNLGAVTWVPDNVVLTLPAGYKAFNTQKEMSDTGFDEVPGRGAKLRGTFAPGQHETHFRYQVPYSGDDTIAFSTALPPHVARMKVIAEASKDMTLHVAGFPTAQSDRNQKGQRVLVTERQLRGGDVPIARAEISLQNIPTEGAAKWIAVGISALTIALGAYAAFEAAQGEAKSKRKGRRREDEDVERARRRLVVEIAALDKAHTEGALGPKAYARIRQALVDALARLMAVPEA